MARQVTSKNTSEVVLPSTAPATRGTRATVAAKPVTEASKEAPKTTSVAVTHLTAHPTPTPVDKLKLLREKAKVLRNTVKELSQKVQSLTLKNWALIGLSTVAVGAAVYFKWNADSAQANLSALKQAIESTVNQTRVETYAKASEVFQNTLIPQTKQEAFKEAYQAAQQTCLGLVKNVSSLVDCSLKATGAKVGSLFNLVIQTAQAEASNRKG